jgi:serine phosphatase RsbU (regulator of sigma subunit)
MTSDTAVVDVTRDWTTACDVQERFMQHAGPTVDTLSYSARCRQVRALGGDFYDFMPLPHNRLGLAVGDASGKGLAAALMIAESPKASCCSASTSIPPPAASPIGPWPLYAQSPNVSERIAS